MTFGEKCKIFDQLWKARTILRVVYLCKGSVRAAGRGRKTVLSSTMAAARLAANIPFRVNFE